MICPACGYAMDSFDKECPRCHGKGIAKPNAPAPTPLPPVQNTQSLTPKAPPQSPSKPDQVPSHQQSQYYAPHGQQFPQPVVVQTNVRGGGFLNGLGGGTGAALGCCCLAPFLVFMLFGMLGSMTMAGKKQADQNVEAEKVVTAQEIAITNTAANITSTGSEYWKQNTITVTGNVKNSSRSERSVRLEARIYNNGNVMVASGTSYETVPAGETKLFSIRVDDDTQTSPFTYKVMLKQ